MTTVALLFPGQGSQYPGMGLDVFNDNESVRARFDQASEILGHSVAELCFEAAPAELTRTANAQIALLVLSYAMYEVLDETRRPRVTCMAGHSLGEITALLAAGALSFEDAVRLVKVRGEAMDECAASAETGMIAALDVPATQVERLLQQFNADGHGVQVANYNGPTQTVVAGSRAELKQLTTLLEGNGVRVALLNVAGAFHSPYMAGAVPAFVAAISETPFHTPRVPVYSTVTGRRYEGADDIRDALSGQLTSPVRWSAVVEGISRREPDAWIEVGPKTVLTKMVARMLGDDQIVFGLDGEPALRDAGFERLDAAPGGPSAVALCLGAAAATRNRNFDDAAYTAGVINPYRQLVELNQNAEAPLSDETLFGAIQLLRTIMQTKGVPAVEQSDRIGSILGRTGGADLAERLGVAPR